MIPLRDENPSATPPVVTRALLVLNVALFVYEVLLGPALRPFLYDWGLVPMRLTLALRYHEGELPMAIASAFTSLFLHGGWSHLIGNLWYLWIFGDNIEDRLGHVRYALFYILSGYAATFAHAFANPHSPVPAIGASGAISGVLGAYVILYPGARIVTLLFLGFFARLIEIPAWVYLPVWFLMQLFSGLAALDTPAEQGGVAWFAHIGGFVAGPILLLLLGGWRRRA